MAENNAWANGVLYEAVCGLTPEAFRARRPGFFPSLCQTLNHIYEVDLYYLDALEEGGRGRSVYDREEVCEAGELARLQRAADARFVAFCKDLTPERLAGTRVTDRPEGPVREEVAALVLHLVQHQIHHRGQAHVQLGESGIAPPQLDEFYLAYDRAPGAATFFE